MAEPILTAGQAPQPTPAADPRKAAVRTIREVLRNPAATDDEFEDALAALTELAKD